MARVGALCALWASVVASGTPAGAIVYGQPTAVGEYANVGQLIVIVTVDGATIPAPLCTGTLIDEDSFLTAAHCVPGLEEIQGLFPFVDAIEGWGVAFDQQFGPSSVVHRGTPHAHPDFPGPASDVHDIAVLELDHAVAIQPASIAPVGYLDGINRSERFTTVGYGAVRETQKKAAQSIFADGVKRKAEQSMLSLTRAWLTLSMNQATGNGGTCYGDSGGPHFHNGLLVSLTITGDTQCKATDRTYRVDTSAAREFVRPFLEE